MLSFKAASFGETISHKMSPTESIVEEAAPAWFGEQSRVAHPLIPAFCRRPSPLRSGSQREKEEEREAIRRLNPALIESSFSRTMPKLF